MITKRILIIEDDLQTLSTIMDRLFKLEERLVGKFDFAVTVFSEHRQVKDYLNQTELPNFDLIILDRDSKEGGSFHALNIEKLGIEKVIAISTVPDYNDEILRRGAKRAVAKDYLKIDEFGDNLLAEIEDLLCL